MSTDSSARPGSARHRPATIGRYRILDRIGRGAMGVVYSARDDKMDRDVALKMMMGALEAEPDVRARFSEKHNSPPNCSIQTSSPSSTLVKTMAGSTS